MRKQLWSFLVLIAFVLSYPPGYSAASPERISYGDVRAHFEAFEGGGSVVFFRTGSPAQDLAASANLFKHSIRPFPDSPWDGASFCEDDWHLLVIAISHAALEGEPMITRREGVNLLEQYVVDLILDEQVLTNIETTPIKRLVESLALLDDGLVYEVFNGWWFQTGAFFAPGELSTGLHELSATIAHPEFGVYIGDSIEFYIDASGTGSCI